MESTFVEGIETDYFDFKVSIESHLSEDIFAKSSFACS